jgi:hypothetical protein
MGTHMPSRSVSAWQCMGCGRIEGEQPCIGICEDRRTDFVPATAYDEVLAQSAQVLAQSAQLRERIEVLAALVRQIAHTFPRQGEWESTYRALQVRARRTLQVLADEVASLPT